MEIERHVKRVKRFTLSIKPDGRILLTVPYYATKKEEEEFLKKSQKWLEEKYSKVVDRTLFYDAIEGSMIYILGNQYLIRIISSDKNKVEIVDSILNIYTKDLDHDYTLNVLNKYLDKLRKDTYTEVLNKYLPLFNESIEKLRIRRLKASYGICYPKRREIVLSSTLIHKPIDFIESVVAHEINHLKHPGHQKDFYDSLYQVLPDYKIRAKHLTNDID